ncbi:MAG: glycoside hydrolase family 3 C-terminal domain-containing protein [Odoribacteraceae bacterium]|jgi:beta-glucosidase|nr:glycoside hydrolase family 3 C-terminal domain-containing protein [Odoribacteraceae bacterium]
MNKFLITALFPALLLACAVDAPPVYKERDAPIEARVEDLLARMTVEEKVMQTVQRTYGKNMNPNNVERETRAVDPLTGSLIYRSPSPAYRNRVQREAVERSRLGIPLLFGFDVIHGFRVIFPVPLAQSCSWNVDLVRASCAVAAREAKLSGVDWTFSPMIDVARDARWGRVVEGYGEDPHANAVYGAAAVRGYQGDDLAGDHSIAACLKHYVGYSLSDGGRDYHYSDVSPQALWETFMPPYEAGVRAGAATVMSAFNDISGVPASANPYTLTTVLKQRWGHDGFVVSDWGSIQNLVPQGVAADEREACLQAFTAGVEMDMVDDIYARHLPALVEEGRVSIARLDEAVRRVLRVKFRLGLFDRPYVEELPDDERFLRPGDVALARRLAVESMVLLENKDDLLPLAAGAARRLAVIGPLARDSVALLGSWAGHGEASDACSLLDGLRARFGGEVTHARGCDHDGEDTTGFAAARRVASRADVVVLCLGERAAWSGENASRASLALPAIQERLAAEVRRAGKPVVLVVSAGRPLDLARVAPLAGAVVMIWQPGIEGGRALADILSGDENPSGRLSITFPRGAAQQPAYYNQRQPARPGSGGYQDLPAGPLYPFAHGLSYTRYEYGEIALSSDRVTRDGTITASVEVRNAGDRPGDETVFWFVSDPVASISRPVKELKHFEKRGIPAGGTRRYTFEIVPSRDLSFPGPDGLRRLEPGVFHLRVKDRVATFSLVD